MPFGPGSEKAPLPVAGPSIGASHSPCANRASPNSPRSTKRISAISDSARSGTRLDKSDRFEDAAARLRPPAGRSRVALFEQEQGASFCDFDSRNVNMEGWCLLAFAGENERLCCLTPSFQRLRLGSRMPGCQNEFYDAFNFFECRVKPLGSRCLSF